ncbi:IS66 family insertion sequence element accessory protein TnpA [Parapusillimonas sp. JC17]|uniref:IS66 family insertion sequence element accessory protein TnpA n=1 Tax=Parapusillimonas sp. JC17 TaxID=3445768 RepID=UPI003FA053A1
MSNKGYEYWAAHLAAIADEGIDTKAYARRESLSVCALYYWRRRIKARQHGPHPLAAVSQDKESGRKLFMPVQIKNAASEMNPNMACCVTLGSGLRLELSELPAPQWLAQLSQALNSQVR